MGSPPRMRGKAMPPANIKKSSRITPAYAGKRISGTMQTTIRQGSPPRMRGKVVMVHRRVPPRRITPAYAGKSWSFSLSQTCTKDHPRVCGEKRKDNLDYYVPQGSPPRMRGKETHAQSLPVSILERYGSAPYRPSKYCLSKAAVLLTRVLSSCRNS